MTRDPAALDAAARHRERNTARGPALPERTPWGAVVAFLVLAYGLAWVVQLPVWRGTSAPRGL